MPQVSTRHPDYEKMLPVWTQMRDQIDGGERVVKEKGQAYLPPLNVDETATSANYINYLSCATYFNAVGLTFQAFTGLIFRKPPRISDGLADSLTDNIDLEGNSLTTFMRDVVEEQNKIGRIGILQDVLDSVQGATIADNAISNGGRGFLKKYPAESIINWKHEVINGVRKPVMVTLVEYVEKDPDDIFGHDLEEQYLVLRLIGGVAHKATYNAQQDLVSGPSVIVVEGAPLDYLPFTILNSTTVGYDVQRPSLEDLASVNLAHYRASASLGVSIQMYGRSTIVFSIADTLMDEFEKKKISYGPSSKIVLPVDPTGVSPEVKFLEPTKSLEPVMAHMRDLESKMASLGARMLSEAKEVAESPDAINLDLIGEFALIAAIASTAGNAFSMILSSLTRSDVDVEFNSDYVGKTLDANTINALSSAVKDNLVSVEQAQDALQTGEVVRAEKDITTDTSTTNVPSDMRIDLNPAPTEPANGPSGQSGGSSDS